MSEQRTKRHSIPHSLDENELVYQLVGAVLWDEVGGDDAEIPRWCPVCLSDGQSSLSATVPIFISVHPPGTAP